MVVIFIFDLSVRSLFFFFKQKTAYEMRISDWSSDVCSSDLGDLFGDTGKRRFVRPAGADEAQDRIQHALADRDAAHCPLRFQQVGRGQEIGRASCRERVCQYVSISVVAVSLKKKNDTQVESTDRSLHIA